MASVEYAVKYPRNDELEKDVLKFIKAHPKEIYFGGDWTKLCVRFGLNGEKYAFAAQKFLESIGVYPEFCDGNIVMFYLSPATTKKDFSLLKKILLHLLCFRYPLFFRKDTLRTIRSELQKGSKRRHSKRRSNGRSGGSRNNRSNGRTRKNLGRRRKYKYTLRP